MLDRFNMQSELNGLISQLHHIAIKLATNKFNDKTGICQETDALLVLYQEKIKNYTNNNNAF